MLTRYLIAAQISTLWLHKSNSHVLHRTAQ